jgi:hypothetical protein
MNKLQTKIVNAETGEEEIRDMNAEELAQLKTDKEAAVAILQQKANAEASKSALLDRLGITSEEAKLLLG